MTPEEMREKLLELKYKPDRVEQLLQDPKLPLAFRLMNLGDYSYKPDRALQLMHHRHTPYAIEVAEREGSARLHPNRGYQLAQEEEWNRHNASKREVNVEHKRSGIKKWGNKLEKALRKPVKALLGASPLGLLAPSIGGAGPAGPGSEEDEGPGGAGTAAPQQAFPEAEQESQSPLTAFSESPLEIFRKLFPKRHHGKSALAQFMPEPIKQYAQGGFTGHIKESDSSGIADDIPKKIPNGSYVWNATDLSLLGDGSSDHGVKKVKQFEDHFERSGIVRNYEHDGRLIDAKVSNDEYVMKPSTVAAIGKKFAGDPRKGPQVIDKARETLRKQKGVKKILPPKAKEVTSYFRGGF